MLYGGVENPQFVRLCMWCD